MKPLRPLALLGVFAVGGLHYAWGCGLDLGLPKLHFDGVEENGYVCYFEKLADVALDDKNVLTMTLNFNSHREASSPYVGKGWSIPFLDAHVEPVDENGFKIIMPNGLIYDFGRIAGQDNMYSGNMGWKASIAGDTLTAWASCGWAVIFQKGKISEITTPQNHVLSYRYNGGIATEIDARDGASNSVLVQVQTDATTGSATSLIIGDQKISISQAQRPRIMTKLDQNLVTGFDQSLSQLQWPDGKKESFAFGTDKTLNPTLAITYSDQTQRIFTWDPTTRQIKTDGEWIYNLTPGDNVALNRTNAKGQTEGYDSGNVSGISIEKALDGSETKTYKFTGGAFQGKVRKIEKIDAYGVKTIIWSVAYDEKGNVIRCEKGPYRIEYSSTENPLKIYKSGKLYWEATYNADGNLTSYSYK